MSKSKTMNDPSPDPTPGDSFTVPVSDSFSPPDESQTVQLWAELRTLLTGLIDKPASPADREQADNLVRRLGLDSSLSALFLVSLREVSELEKVIAVGAGMAAEVGRIRRELESYLNLSAADPATNQRNAEAREKLLGQHTAATRLAEAAVRASSGLRHLHVWLWILFTDENPCPEQKDYLGQVRRQSAGILSSSICPPKTAAAAADLQIDPYVWDSWRQLSAPQPAATRRRYRTQQITPPAGVSALGVSPHRF